MLRASRGYDAKQVCLNGHVITGSLRTRPQEAKEFCPKCGEKTISKCPSCTNEIKGYLDGIGPIRSREPSPQAFCEYCGKPFPWTVKAIEAADELADELEGLSIEDREMLKTAIHDLIQQGPYQDVAEIRFKQVMRKVGEEGVALARAVLYGVLAEEVRRRLFGG